MRSCDVTTAAHALNTNTHTRRETPNSPLSSFCIPRITRRLPPPPRCSVCGGARSRSAESRQINSEGTVGVGEGWRWGESLQDKNNPKLRKKAVLSSKNLWFNVRGMNAGGTNLLS